MRDMMRKGMGNGACPMCGEEPCACEGESESEMEGGEEEGYESSEGDSEPEEEGEMDVEALKQEAISALFDKGTDDMMKKEIAQALADGDFEHVKMLLADSKGPMKKPKGIAVMIGVK
jgi:hypothetical protein